MDNESSSKESARVEGGEEFVGVFGGGFYFAVGEVEVEGRVLV
jgi:hypothetical protein